MKEQQVYETVVRRQIVDDDAIKRYAKAAEPKQKPALRVWKPIAIVLGALLAVAGLTASIPQARAEVMRWFAPKSAGEYMAQNPERQEPVRELNTVIVPAERSETNVEIQTVEKDEIWQAVAKGLETAELGDTLFDGENLYIRLQMNGLGMLPSIEEKYGTGNLTKIAIPPELTVNYFEANRTPKEYLTGEATYWMEAEYFVYYVFADGTSCDLGYLDMTVDGADIQPLIDSLEEDDLHHGNGCTPEEFAACNERELAYLSDRTIHACITTHLGKRMDSPFEPREQFESHADENGVVTVTVLARVLQDFGDGKGVTMVQATLGKVTVDLNAYKHLEKTALKADAPKVFAPEQTFYTRWQNRRSRTGDYVTSVNIPLALDGLTLTALDGAYIDALGIHDLRILMTAPESWNDTILKDSYGLRKFLHFRVLLNGEPNGYFNSINHERQEDGSLLMTFDHFEGVPFDRYQSIETVTLIPTFTHETEMTIYAKCEDGLYSEPISVISLEPEVTYSNKGVFAYWSEEIVEYPQYAITFAVD